VSDPQSEDPFEAVIDRDFADWMRLELEAIIAKLDERAAAVIRWRFYERKTFKEIAAMLGISNNAARRVEQNALKEMRDYIGALSSAEWGMASYPGNTA
jgi:RNA polymerase sigma factor (sigma-70 family)